MRKYISIGIQDEFGGYCGLEKIEISELNLLAQWLENYKGKILFICMEEVTEEEYIKIFAL